MPPGRGSQSPAEGTQAPGCRPELWVISTPERGARLVALGHSHQDGLLGFSSPEE